jgi:glycosyltransferase involved in cell wall biosynthesis
MKTTLVIVGPLPPPVHGAAIVTEQVRNKLANLKAESSQFGLVVCDTSGGTRPTRNLLYHAKRSLAHFRAALTILAVRCRGEALVYFGGAGGAGLWYQAALAAVARASKCRIIFHHHSYQYIETRYSRAMAGLARMMSEGDCHIFLTREMADAFRRHYDTCAQAHVVSNSKFLEPIGRIDGRSESQPLRLLHISNLSAEKGSVEVLKAFRNLRESGLEATLTVAGPIGDDVTAAEIRALAASHPADFTYLGSIDHASVPSVIDRSDLFLFPTKYVNEAQPLVVLEALSRGVPTLASGIGAISCMLPHEWLIEADNELEAKIAWFASERRDGNAARALHCFNESGADSVELNDLVRHLMRPAGRPFSRRSDSRRETRAYEDALSEPLTRGYVGREGP